MRLRKATLKEEKKLRAAPTTFATATDAAAVIVDVVCCAGASSSSLRCTTIVVVRDLFTNLNKIHVHTYIHMYTKMPENTAKLVLFRVRSNILWAQILQGRKSQCVSLLVVVVVTFLAIVAVVAVAVTVVFIYRYRYCCCCVSRLFAMRGTQKKSIMAISVNNPL